MSTKPNLGDPEILNKIDQLYSSGVGTLIDLPQLIVVGDQSSGKSSVLEGLTNLPFPRDSGLCTRFATKILFKRDTKRTISVSIRPDALADDEHKERVQQWGKKGLTDLDVDTFAAIMREVHEVMQLGSAGKKGTRGTFSDDVLEIKVCGPDEEHFSVVDVPGIFRNITEGVTTKKDKEMVDNMVKEHMKNSRSVILAVIPANVDSATQEILSWAEEFDPEGSRTLGVLTKPDLVDSGAEGAVMDLINGKKHPLKLGWCVVRNPGQKQLQEGGSNRGSIEDNFFRTAPPWNTLEHDRVGIGALRTRLQEILAELTENEFPKVKNDIRSELKKAEDDLKKLGGKRDTASEQRSYLIGISSKFQEIAGQASRANYPKWLVDREDLRFATAVVERNTQFAKDVEKHGHSFKFDRSEGALPDSDSEGEDKSKRAGDKGARFNVHREDQTPDIEDLVFCENTIPLAPSDNILKWIKEQYLAIRGFDLGTFNSSMLLPLMNQQSANWEPLALGYIKDVITLAHRFILALLRLVCPEERVRRILMSMLQDALFARYRKVVEHVQFLLRVERECTPWTENHYFNDNLQKCRGIHFKNSLSGKKVYLNGAFYVRHEDLGTSNHMSNDDHLIRDIHDILKSYYKVARKRFVDNVCQEGTGYHLVNGPESPLYLFNPSFVGGLTDQQLSHIAGEDANVRRRRSQLQKEIEKLEAGMKVLRS